MRTNGFCQLALRVSFLSTIGFIANWVTPALADPLTGQILKFEQLPLNNGVAPSLGGAPYFGHDERSIAYLNTAGTHDGGYVADDFSDKVSTPIVHVQWWGSYINNVVNNGVNQFLISFATDVPALSGVPSHPGTFLSNEVVTLGGLSPGSGTFTEQLINGATPGDHLYQYNAELAIPFNEQANTIYWLSIVALSNDPTMAWGWHNRDYGLTNSLFAPVSPGETNIGSAASPVWHFQDDAVVGGILGTVQVPGFSSLFYQDTIDGPAPFGSFSQDMAFRLYTVPEPSSFILVGMSITAFGATVRRRRTVGR